MKKVQAYQTSDGQLFTLNNKEMAERHQKEIMENESREKIFQENQPKIQNHIFANLHDQLREHVNNLEDVGFYHEGRYGWDCGGEGNPIDICIYSPDIYMGNDQCVYCGNPSERK